MSRILTIHRAIAYEKPGRWFTAEEPFLRAKEHTDAGSAAFRHPRSELIAPLPQEVEPAFNNRKLHMRLPWPQHQPLHHGIQVVGQDHDCPPRGVGPEQPARHPARSAFITVWTSSLLPQRPRSHQ